MKAERLKVQEEQREQSRASRSISSLGHCHFRARLRLIGPCGNADWPVTYLVDSGRRIGQEQDLETLTFWYHEIPLCHEILQW